MFIDPTGEAMDAIWNRTCIAIASYDSPIPKVTYRIAVRVGTKPYEIVNGVKKYDYHFMVQTKSGQWAEKHGEGGTTIIWPQGYNPSNIAWTLSGQPYYDSRIAYYAISPAK